MVSYSRCLQTSRRSAGQLTRLHQIAPKNLITSIQPWSQRFSPRQFSPSQFSPLNSVPNQFSPIQFSPVDSVPSESGSEPKLIPVQNTKNCKIGFATTKFSELYMVEACQKHLMRDQANFVVSPDAKLPIFSVTSCFFHLLDTTLKSLLYSV